MALRDWGEINLNIIVTGGAGYIGSHACKALAAKGHVPVTYDNLSRGNLFAVKWGPLKKGDIADVQRVRDVLERYRPSALMHFAAYQTPAALYTAALSGQVYSASNRSALRQNSSEALMFEFTRWQQLAS